MGPIGRRPEAQVGRELAWVERLVLRLITIDRKLVVGVERGRIPDLEVVMRPASVFVRDLLPEEGVRLKRLSRKAASEAKRERALIVWASATRMPVSQIATLVGTDESHVRKVVRAFNERGFASLDPEQRGGRPRRILWGMYLAHGGSSCPRSGLRTPRTLPSGADEAGGPPSSSSTGYGTCSGRDGHLVADRARSRAAR